MKFVAFGLRIWVCTSLAIVGGNVYASPRITCEPTKLDFGTVNEGSETKGEFILKNMGDAALEISAVETGCGCTKPLLSSKSIAPGSQAKLTVLVSLAGMHGVISKSVVVRSNDPAAPVTVLSVEGKVKSWVKVSSPQVVFNLGNKSERRTKAIPIQVEDWAGTKLTEVVSSSPRVKASLERPGDDGSYLLNIEAVDAPGGEPFQAVVQVLSDNPDRSISINVNGLVVPDLTVSPAAVILVARNASPVTRDITVMAQDGKSFQIVEVKAPLPSILADVVVLDTASYRIRLNNLVPDKELDGKCILIKTNVPGMGDIRIPFSVIVPGSVARPRATDKEMPKIACDHPEYQFGTRESGVDVKGQFLIRNDGSGLLKILKLIPGCGCTSAKMSQNVIAPGGYATLTASLSLASQSGMQRKEIEIVSTDSENPSYRVYLVGDVVEPISVEPSDGVFFGAVDAHAGEERVINLVAPTPDKAFHIRELLVGDKQSLTTRYEEVEKEKAYRVYVTLNKDLTPGEFHSWVHIRTTNLKFPVIALPITATVSGELAVAPSDLKIFIPKDKGGATRYIAVSPGRVRSFQVTGVETPLPSIQVAITPMEHGTYRIKLSGLMPVKELDGTSILIKTNVPEMPVIRIPIHVINTGHPPITTQPSRSPQQAGKSAPTPKPAPAEIADVVQ